MHYEETRHTMERQPGTPRARWPRAGSEASRRRLRPDGCAAARRSRPRSACAHPAVWHGVLRETMVFGADYPRKARGTRSNDANARTLGLLTWIIWSSYQGEPKNGSGIAKPFLDSASPMSACVLCSSARDQYYPPLFSQSASVFLSSSLSQRSICSYITIYS
jgi:hypothetical protein